MCLHVALRDALHGIVDRCLLLPLLFAAVACKVCMVLTASTEPFYRLGTPLMLCLLNVISCRM